MCRFTWTSYIVSFYVGTHTCVGEKLFPVVWDVIESLELYGIQVVSLSSDGAKPNRRFYSLCLEETLTIPYKTTNPYSANPLHACSDLFLFCDPPHLLKTTRNCFSNSFSHSKSRQLKVCVCACDGCVYVCDGCVYVCDGCVCVCVCMLHTVCYYPCFVCRRPASTLAGSP